MTADLAKEILMNIASPVGVSGFVWYLLKIFFSRQEELIQQVVATIADLRLKLAVHEEQTIQLKALLPNFQAIREEQIFIRSRVDAIAVLIDKIHQIEGRQDQELGKLWEEVHRIRSSQGAKI